MKSVKFYYANYIFCLFAALARGCMRFPASTECKFAFPSDVSCWLEKGATHAVETVHADTYQRRGKGARAKANLEI
jgi:hypothetical protein